MSALYRGPGALVGMVEYAVIPMYPMEGIGQIWRDGKGFPAARAGTCEATDIGKNATHQFT